MASERLPNAVNSILETPLGEDVVPPTIEPIHVRGGAEVAGCRRGAQRGAGECDRSRGRAGRAAPQHRGLVREPRSPQPEPALPPARPHHAPRAGRVGRRGARAAVPARPPRHPHAPQRRVAARARGRRAGASVVGAGARSPTCSVPRSAKSSSTRECACRPIDETTVVGKAVADVSHIVAELVENALAFSPPDSDVSVYGRHGDEGYTITIVDTGIGMSEEDIERANRRLRASEDFTVAPSRVPRSLRRRAARRCGTRSRSRSNRRRRRGDGRRSCCRSRCSTTGWARPIDEMPEVGAFSFGDFALPDEFAAARRCPEPVDGVSTPVPVGADDGDSLDVPDFMASAAFIVEPDPVDEVEAEVGRSRARSRPHRSQPPRSRRAVVEEPRDRRGTRSSTPSPASPTSRTASPAPGSRRRPVRPRRRCRPSCRCRRCAADLPGSPDPQFASTTFADAAVRGRTASRRRGSRRRRSRSPSRLRPAPTRVRLRRCSTRPRRRPRRRRTTSRSSSRTDRNRNRCRRSCRTRPTAPIPTTAAPEFSFVAAPIQDDLLPQLPRRSGRRGRGAETAAPEVPAQVLRIAATVGPAEPHGEPDTIVALAPESVQAAAPGAPPLPRRELDAASVAPPPRAPVYEPPVDEDDRARPNYELFAAFRAATDQGRADAVRGSDGGGA